MEENTQQQTVAEEKVVEQVETPATEQDPVETKASATETQQTSSQTQQKTEKTYTKAEMNEIIKGRLSKLYNEYGVENSDGLKELVGKAQSLEETQRQLEEAKRELQELKNDVLLKDSGISSKYIDLAKLYFKSKELEVNGDNIKQLLKEYPEWNSSNQPNAPFKIGAEKTDVTPTKTPRQMVEEIFGKIGG